MAVSLRGAARRETAWRGSWTQRHLLSCSALGVCLTDGGGLMSACSGQVIGVADTDRCGRDDRETVEA